MCHDFEDGFAIQATGVYKKGNEPVSIKMPIVAAQCKCGKWYAQVVNNNNWVECELLGE
jgi:hypothetical protein